MKKILLSLTALFITCALFSQDTATIRVKVLNENLEPIVGEQIIFEDQNKTFKASKTSDENGMMDLRLLGGKTYNIQIKTVGEAQDYNTFEIPALGENQQYGINELTITIYETKTFTLDNVYFDSGKSSLKVESYAELNELFEYLSNKKSIQVEISGHTDDVGDDDANMKLSADRANAVKNYLTKKGIEADRVKTSAFGETKPVASNDSAEGRAQNRRIEVSVL